MRRSNSIIVIVLGLLLLTCTVTNAQTLQVSLSPDKSKVDRSTSNGTATIFFDTKVKGLNIVCTDENPNEPLIKASESLWFIHIDVNKDIDSDGVCYRNFLLTSESSSEYYLTTDAIMPNQVLYYTVVLPSNYPSTLSVEYLFSKSAKHNVRLSYGKRIGGFVSFKWGDYRASGTNIDAYNHDCDLSLANNIGGIRMAIIGGMKMGLLRVEIKDIKYTLFLLAGIGYGTYGRQWKNPMLVGENTYFYSDYIKGVDSEISLQLYMADWLNLSIGTDVIIGSGKVSVDYLLGLGLNFNTDRLFRKRKI